MNPIVQCLGGWCHVRGRCAHYHATGIPGRAPIERLCEPGKDEPTPIKLANTPVVWFQDAA